MRKYPLKTSSNFFQLIKQKVKTCEVRSIADRTFQVGDIATLHEIIYLEDDTDSPVWGETIDILITHILTHDDFPQGIQPGYAVLSFHLVEDIVGFPEEKQVLRIPPKTPIPTSMIRITV